MARPRQAAQYQGGGSRRIVALDFAKLASIVGLEALPKWAQRELEAAASRSTIQYSEASYPYDFEAAAKALRDLVDNPATAARLEPIIRAGDDGALGPLFATLYFLEGLAAHRDAGLSPRDALIGSCLAVLDGLGVPRPRTENDYGKFTTAQEFVLEVLRTCAHNLPSTEKAQMALINKIEVLRNPPKNGKK